MIATVIQASKGNPWVILALWTLGWAFAGYCLGRFRGEQAGWRDCERSLHRIFERGKANRWPDTTDAVFDLAIALTKPDKP